MKENYKIDTKCVRGGYEPKNGEPRNFPIYQSTTFNFESTEQMAKIFDLQDGSHFYTRLGNPTTDHVAAKLTELEGGIAGILTSSGQAASFFSLFNFISAGDHFISSSAIYGGTHNLFLVTMKRMGIECTMIDPDCSEDELNAAFKPNTKAVFAESLSNPTLVVLDFEKFSKVAHANGVPLIIDNTFPTPVHCRPFEHGADIVVHSTTKYLDGHATSVGGAIIDSGNFDWTAHGDKFPELTTPDDSYHGMIYTEAFGKGAYVTKLVGQMLRDLGSTPAPQNSFYIGLHMETLPLRMKKHFENALKVAEYLEGNDKIGWVNFPHLKSNKYYDLAMKYLPDGGCGVVTFGVKGNRETVVRFMDNLKLASIATHVADAKTCVLYPAAHTHRQLSSEELKEAGIGEDLIRFSVGIENADDIIADIEQALNA